MGYSTFMDSDHQGGTHHNSRENEVFLTEDPDAPGVEAERRAQQICRTCVGLLTYGQEPKCRPAREN